MNYEALKQRLLAHCLWIATMDPEYAIWRAGWYEELMPWLLKNLQAKVKQEVRRSTSGPSLPVEGSSDEPAE